MSVQETISQRIRQILKERDIPPKTFGQRLGIHNFGRMLRNERNWTLRNLEKVAAALGITVGSLTSEHVDVPVLREINAAEAFPFPRDLDKEVPVGWAPAPGIDIGGIVSVSKMYGIAITNGSFAPFLKKGTTLVAQKETSDEIETGDIVVYCCPKGMGNIGKVTLVDDKVIFKPLSPLEPEEKLLDRGQLVMMDRIVFIKL